MSFDERFVFEDSAMDNIIYNEHKVRYDFACQFVRDRIVLDIASGSGYGSSLLARAGARKVVGMDIDQDAVVRSQAKYGLDNLEYRHGSVINIQLADNSQDVIVSFETIEHVEDYEQMLREVERVLKADGVFLVSTPNRKVYGEKNPYHLKEFERAEFEELLKKYFPFCRIINQINTMASTIDCGEGEALFAVNNETEAHYFVAICSNIEVKIPQKTFINSNPQALERLKNNPVLRFSDVVYGFLSKIMGRIKN